MDASDPAHPVQQQLAAYNARDIDAFMPCWAEDCEYYEFPDRLLARGAAEIRARHLARFQEPSLHGHLRHRITLGNMVIDHETVTRSFPEGPGEIDVVAIYQVSNGKIAKAWFKQGPPRLHAAPSIRLATPDDAADVGALTRAAYAKWVPIIHREPKPMTADPHAAIRLHRVDLLHIAGTLAALIETIPLDDHLLIENVAVAPAFQHRGLGRQLLAHAEHLAATQGRKTIRLYTNKAFAANVLLYLKFGYAIDREEDSHLGTTVYMSKPVYMAKPAG